MKNWITVTNVATEKDIFLNVSNIVSISPALQQGNAYGRIECSNGAVIFTEERYIRLRELIKESLNGEE